MNDTGDMRHRYNEEVNSLKKRRLKKNTAQIMGFYLKNGWEVQEFNNGLMLRLIVPCMFEGKKGFARFDIWPSSGKVRRTGDTKIIDAKNNPGGHILSYLKAKNYIPITS